ncbi:MAG: hypothetical protein PVI92_14655 [Chromatiales bacterium]|jgi:hypothetical protein
MEEKPGSIADQANPKGYICTNDNGSWEHNADAEDSAIAGCGDVVGPIGTPTPLLPHLTGPAVQQNKASGGDRFHSSAPSNLHVIPGILAKYKV